MRAIPYLLIAVLAGCAGVSRTPGQVQTYDVTWDQYPELDEQSGEVERPPELVGGLAGLQRRLSALDTPQRCPYSGEVVVEAVVDEEGRVSEAQLAQGIGGPCDGMALEVVRESEFVPLLVDGQPRKVLFKFPIRYR